MKEKHNVKTRVIADNGYVLNTILNMYPLIISGVKQRCTHYLLLVKGRDRWSCRMSCGALPMGVIIRGFIMAWMSVPAQFGGKINDMSDAWFQCCGEQQWCIGYPAKLKKTAVLSDGKVDQVCKQYEFLYWTCDNRMKRYFNKTHYVQCKHGLRTYDSQKLSKYCMNFVSPSKILCLLIIYYSGLQIALIPPEGCKVGLN